MLGLKNVSVNKKLPFKSLLIAGLLSATALCSGGEALAQKNEAMALEQALSDQQDAIEVESVTPEDVQIEEDINAELDALLNEGEDTIDAFAEFSETVEEDLLDGADVVFDSKDVEVESADPADDTPVLSLDEEEDDYNVDPERVQEALDLAKKVSDEAAKAVESAEETLHAAAEDVAQPIFAPEPPQKPVSLKATTSKRSLPDTESVSMASEIVKMQSELDTARQANRQLTEELTDVQGLSPQNQHLKADTERLRQENLSLLTRLDEIQSELRQIEGAEEVNVDLENRYLREKIDAIQKNLALKELHLEKIPELSAQVSSLSTENEILTQQNERYIAYREENALLKQELGAEEQKSRELAARLAQIEVDKAEVVDTLQSISGPGMDALKNEIAGLRRENETLASRLALAKKAGQILLQRFNAEKTVSVNLREKLDMMRFSVEDASKNVRGSESKYASVLDRLSELKSLNNALVEENSRLKANQAHLEQTQTQIKGRLQSQTSELQKSLEMERRRADMAAEELAKSGVQVPFKPQMSPALNAGQTPEPLLPGPDSIASGQKPIDQLGTVVSTLSKAMIVNADRVETLMRDDARIYQWSAGAVLGSAEEKSLGNQDFDALAQEYLSRAEERCVGDFAALPDDSVEFGSLRVDSYDIACFAPGVDASASLVFYNDDQNFYAVAHEAESMQMDKAMGYRERLIDYLSSL